MNLWNSLAIGLREILSHKFRSFLTMLGVILGVASLLTTFALIEGLAHKQREIMTALGGVEKVDIVKQEVPASQAGFADTWPGRTVADAFAIRERCPLIAYVSPSYEISSVILRGSNDFRGRTRGVWPDHLPVNNHTVEFGRSICQVDLDEARHVCVIGTKVVAELWPESPNCKPLGETIMLNQRPYTVIGILEYYESEDAKRLRKSGQAPPLAGKARYSGRGWGPYNYKNETVLIPFTTAFYDFKSAGGSPAGGTVSGSGNVSNTSLKDDPGPNYLLDGLAVQVADAAQMAPALDQVRVALLHTHRGVEDFTFETRQEWADATEASNNQIRMVGGLISSIALIVGGIGITNIMLASITERIREIGVRRAVGAKSRHIFTQIVVESTVVAILGGILGSAAAIGLMEIIRVATNGENAPIIDFQAAVISFGFATIIGIVSGLYPAWRASRIQPIEALRYG